MIRLLTDSTSDISIAKAKEENIAFIPLRVNINNTEYLDGVTLMKDQFYNLLTSSNDFPKTSQPSPNDYIEVFEEVKAKGDELICILLSSALSGTYQSAKLAKEVVGYDKIHLIDSKSATAGIQLLIVEAQKLINEGKSAIEIVETLESLKSRIKIVAGVGTLEYLKKGGRLSAAAASIANIARIKPIITLNTNGEVEVFAKALGIKKAFNIIAKTLADADENYSVYPIYTYGTSNLESLKELVKDSHLHFEEANQVGPTIGSHVGPEAYGFIFITK